MRGAEKQSTKGQGSSSRGSNRSNRATTRASRKEAAPSSDSATRAHHLQIQHPPSLPQVEQTTGPFEYSPNLVPSSTTTGMVPSEQNNREPRFQALPMTQPYAPTMSSAPLDNDASNVLPSPGATTPKTATSLPSPPPNNNTDNTNMPEYPQSAYNYGTWTAEEDKTLLNARGQGHHWAQIQRTHFPSKTPNACRKRYERLMERRGIYDLDREKLEKVAHEYMGMRKEIWANLAARVGEKWNVVEAQCMSSGLRTIQMNARSHARRQRHESRVSQRAATAQPPYPYLNTTDTGMLDMINHHHQPHHGGSSIGNTVLAPLGFAPISPLDDDHPGPHHQADQTYNHSQQGGWHDGQHQHQQQQHQGYANTGDGSSSGTPTAEMVTPTASTSSTEQGERQGQGQGFRDYTQQHQPQYPSYGPGPPSSSTMAPSMGYHTGYHMPGPSQRR